MARWCRIWIWSTVLLLAAISATTAEPKRILLIQSFGRDFAPFNEAVGKFREQVAQLAADQVDIYEVALETARFSQSEHDAPVVDYLLAMFAQRPVNLVTTFGAPAAQFSQRYRQRLFPSIPMLFAAVDQRLMQDPALTPNDAVLATYNDLSGGVTNILRLLPNTKNVAVVIGNSLLEKYWVEELHRQFQPFAERVNFVWLNGLSFAEMLQRASKLPAQSAILYLAFLMDAEGVPYEQDRALARLHEVANAPLFGYHDGNFGRGIVGGRLLSFGENSRQAASAAIRILRGGAPDAIRGVTGMTPPMFDWRALQRWNISESLLPPDSEVHFRSATAWELYHWQISTAFGIVFFQAALVGWLLFERRRGRTASALVGKAEVETGRYRENLAHLARVHTVGEMSAALAHEINQPLVAIKNYALAARRRLARGAPLETGKVEELLDKIGGQATRAGDVLYSLRAMIKKHESSATRTEIGQLVADTLTLVEMENGVANIRVESSITPGLPSVFVDRIQIQQVVLNLMRNAIEAVGKADIDSSIINVEVTESFDNQIAVSVADHGPGITPADAEHIFDPFYSTKGTGLGVGLSISRSIVEAHGGYLSFAPNEGGGCIFRFTLPVANEIT
jgi:signal transduction histidine kinase